MARTTATIALLVALAAGCVEQTTYATTDESDRVASHILDEVPSRIQTRVGADFDGKLTLLGYDLDRRSVEPGGTFTVTWYWKCTSPPGPGWRLFTHVLDAQGRSRVNRDAAGPVRKHFQPEHWTEGIVVRDRQKIAIPGKWPSPSLELRVGVWKGKSRLDVTRGPDDGSDRVRGPRLEVASGGGAAAKIPRAAAAPAMDGSFCDEPAWKDAAVLSAFGNTIDGRSVPKGTEVRLMWDDESLYVAAHAEDDYLRSEYTEHDDELWHQDAFEIFLDPGADKKHYYEIQVSPAGVVFDSHLESYRKNRNEWSSGARVAVRTDGTLGDGSDEDRSWTAEIAIPFSSMDRGGGTPPAGGDEWSANFFRVDASDSKPRYSAWSPPMRGDFHALDRFGTLTFEAPDRAADAGPPGRAGTP